MGKDFSKICCCDDKEEKPKLDNLVEPIINDSPVDEKKIQIFKLRNNLSGVTNSLNPPSSNSSKTSEWNNFNPDHLEINIRYGHKEIKFKVKKKYTVSKVITKFIEYEKPEKIEGKLLREDVPLNATDIIGTLDLLENETLDLI